MSNNASTASPSTASPERTITAFICYRRNDGAWHADWIDRALNGLTYTDATGATCRVVTYYDRTAPGVADWRRHHFPSLQAAHALVLICTPGIGKDLTKPNEPDWVYEELRWWIEHHKHAPIVIDAAQGEGERWLPDLVTNAWPDVNRLDLDRKEVEDAASSGDDRYLARWRDRIVKTIRESEQATVFEHYLSLRRQKRLLSAALAGAALLFLTVTALWYHAWRSGERAAQSEEASRKAIGFVSDLFAHADPDRTYGEALTVGQLLRAGTAAAREPELSTRVKWRVLQAMGSAYTGLGDKRRSIELLQESAELAKGLSLELPDRYQLQLALGEALIYNERFAEAKSHLVEARRIAEAMHAGNHTDRSAALVALGDLESWSPEGSLDEARELYTAALQMDAALGYQMNVARDHNRIGYIEFYDGNTEQASTAFQAAIDTARSALGGASNLLVAQYEQDYAGVLYERGDFDGAYARYSDARVQFREVYGPDSGEVASVETNLGRICIERGQVAEGRVLLTHAVQVQETKFGTEFHDLAFSLHNLGLIDAIDGRLADARLKLQRAARISEKHQLHIGAQSLLHEAEIDLAEAKPAEAKVLLDKAAGILRSHEIAGWRLAIHDSARGELSLQRCDLETARKIFATSAAALKARWNTENAFIRADERRRQLLQKALANPKACLPS